MSEPVIIASWAKNSREVLQVRLDSFKGHDVVDLRAWYLGSDDVLRPGKSGLTVGIKHLPQLADALVKAVEMTSAAGIITDDGIKAEQEGQRK